MMNSRTANHPTLHDYLSHRNTVNIFEVNTTLALMHLAYASLSNTSFDQNVFNFLTHVKLEDVIRALIIAIDSNRAHVEKLFFAYHHGLSRFIAIAQSFFPDIDTADFETAVSMIHTMKRFTIANVKYNIICKKMTKPDVSLTSETIDELRKRIDKIDE